MKLKDKFGNEIECSIDEYNNMKHNILYNNDVNDVIVSKKEYDVILPKVRKQYTKIKKYVEWTKEEDNIILSNNNLKKIYRELKKLGRTKSSVKTRIKHLRKIGKYHIYFRNRNYIKSDLQSEIINHKKIKYKSRQNFKKSDNDKRVKMWKFVNKKASEIRKEHPEIKQSESLKLAIAIYKRHISEVQNNEM